MELALEPRGDAMTELVRLSAAEQELRRRVEQVDNEARFANAELTAAREQLVELERKAGAGGPRAQQRRKVEQRLAEAEQAAAQPWRERIAGAEQAVRDARSAVRQHAAQHLDELVDELEQAGAEAAEFVDAAAESFVAAVERCEAVERDLIATVALTGRAMTPADVSRLRSGEAAQAVRQFLAQGGEHAATLRIARPVPAA
jgi:chromosome segregation ATPase